MLRFVSVVCGNCPLLLCHTYAAVDDSWVNSIFVLDRGVMVSFASFAFCAASDSFGRAYIFVVRVGAARWRFIFRRGAEIVPIGHCSGSLYVLALAYGVRHLNRGMMLLRRHRANSCVCARRCAFVPAGWGLIRLLIFSVGNFFKWWNFFPPPKFP